MRLTTRELLAVLHAVTTVTAGDWDGWSPEEQALLEVAEGKLREGMLARRDYPRAAAQVDAWEAAELANPTARDDA